MLSYFHKPNIFMMFFLPFAGLWDLTISLGKSLRVFVTVIAIHENIKGCAYPDHSL